MFECANKDFQDSMLPSKMDELISQFMNVLKMISESDVSSSNVIKLESINSKSSKIQIVGLFSQIKPKVCLFSLIELPASQW